MKILLILSILMTGLLASSTEWLHDYDKAVEKAKVEGKDIYMFVTSDVCKWCKEFDSTTLKSEEVLKQLKEKYILLQVSKESGNIPEKFDLGPVPMHIFLTSEGKTIFEDLGYRGETYFKKLLKELE